MTLYSSFIPRVCLHNKVFVSTTSRCWAWESPLEAGGLSWVTWVPWVTCPGFCTSALLCGRQHTQFPWVLMSHQKQNPSHHREKTLRKWIFFRYIKKKTENNPRRTNTVARSGRFKTNQFEIFSFNVHWEISSLNLEVHIFFTKMFQQLWILLFSLHFKLF